MRIALARITIEFYNNTDIPTKRHALEKVSNELRRLYNVSILEIADFDEPERGILGLSAVIPDSWEQRSADSFLKKLLNYIDEHVPARVLSEDSEIAEYDPSFD